jgi:histidine triad (HIT) family protein
MENCIFCKIASGAVPAEKIWEDDSFLAFLDISPINPGHTLIIPKKHVQSVFEVDEESFPRMFAAAKRLSGPLLRATGAKRLGMLVEGFLIEHAHLHLVPLHGGGELAFSRARKAAPEELAGMGARIRAQV